MVDQLETQKQSQNYVELTESQIFEKIREDLNPLQENLSEKKITIDEAKTELKKINERIQGTKLENKDKREIGRAFEKLVELEKDVDENTLKNEVDEVVKLLEKLTQKDLAGLRKNIKQNDQWNPERSVEVQQGIEESSDHFDLTIEDASEDINPIANRVGKAMKWLNS